MIKRALLVTLIACAVFCGLVVAACLLAWAIVGAWFLFDISPLYIGSVAGGLLSLAAALIIVDECGVKS